MVEINNQRKAFLDMLRTEGIDNGRRKPEIAVMTSRRRRAIYWLPDHPRKSHAKPKKLKSTGAGRYRFFPVGGMPTVSSLPWKTLSPKSQDAVALQQIKERGGFTGDWIVWYPSGNRPLQQWARGFTAGRWLWSAWA